MIVYLRDGRIVEHGSHDELVAGGGAYSELYRRQPVREVETLNHAEPLPRSLTGQR